MSSANRIDPESIRERFLDALAAVFEQGVTRRDALHALSITDSALSKLRHGKAKRPSDQTIELAQRGLGINAGWVRTGLGEMLLPSEERKAAEGRGPAYGAPAAVGASQAEASPLGWETRLSDEEARLVLCYRAAPATEREYILRTAELLARPPAAADRPPSSLPMPLPHAAGGVRPDR